MEDAAELDGATAHLAEAGNVLDALRDLVPGRVELVGGRVAGRFDGRMVRHERVQLDDLAMVVQEVDGELARDIGWDGRDVHVRIALAHHAEAGGPLLSGRIGGEGCDGRRRRRVAMASGPADGSTSSLVGGSD